MVRGEKGCAPAGLEHVREVRDEAPVVLDGAARGLHRERVRLAALDARAQLAAELVGTRAVAVLVDTPHVLAMYNGEWKFRKY